MINPVAKEHASKLRDTIRYRATMPISEAVEMIEPHYEFNIQAAKGRAIRQYIRKCARRERDEKKERVVFILPDRGLIVK